MYFLGGLGEIGRNCSVIEIGGRMLVIDAGLMFPDSDMLGIDLVLPDFSFLRDNASKVDAIALTHAHEDHIGGLPYLLPDLERPRVYGTDLTLGILRSKLEERGMLKLAELVKVDDREMVEDGPFKLQFIPVTHSVPRGCAIAFFTPEGTIIHSGDFKIDNTPVDGRVTDLALLGEIARGGVRLFLSDSTNSEVPGFVPSESSVGAVLRDLLRDHPEKRVIAACFASHLHRVQQLADAAIEQGRKLAFLGRSMTQNVETARSLDVLRIPDAAIIDIADADRLPPGDVCVICTGSQGEPMSALALMAAHEHKRLSVGMDDLVLLSSHPIPGNEAAVHRVIDDLNRTGAEVIHSGVLRGVHVSGHGATEDLKTMLRLVGPDYFVPVHGEFRHLRRHARIASEAGVPWERTLIAEDGDMLEISGRGVEISHRAVPAGFLYVDGIGIGDVGHEVLRDRRALSEEGVVLVVVTVDATTGEIVSGPELITRGWIAAPEAEELVSEAIKRIVASLEEAALEGATDWATMKRRARDAVGRFVWESTKRRPMIIPVIMEV